MSRRKILILGAAAVALTAAAGALTWLVSGARCFALVGEVTCRVPTRAPLVALTFDDGPTAAGLNHVLPLLERHGARATFFLIGREMAARPGLARRIGAAGHEIANHSYSHLRMVGRSAGFYDQEIARTAELLRSEGASGPLLFRPPYGKKLIGLPRAALRSGHRLVMWDVEDPPTTDPAAYAEAVLRQVRPGSIVLMHVMYGSNETAREALPLILEGLKARRLRAVTVTELLAAR